MNRYKILNGTVCFSSGVFQNNLVFTPAKKYIKYFHATALIHSLKPNGISE